MLDPRADTETLVEAALEALPPGAREALRVLDFGVGSGAILAALLGEWPNASGLGIDASPAAAAVAQSNFARLGLARGRAVRVGRWGEGVAGGYDAIVSNPPYIRSGEIAGLDRAVREHDPRLALDGGADGLDAYRALAPEIARLLAPEGRFFVEIGAGQGDDVAAILAGAGLAVTAAAAGSRRGRAGDRRELARRAARGESWRRLEIGGPPCPKTSNIRTANWRSGSSRCPPTPTPTATFSAAGC